MYKLCFMQAGEIEETLNGFRLVHRFEIDVQTKVTRSLNNLTGTKDADARKLTSAGGLGVKFALAG